MAVLRKAHKSNFTVIDNQVFKSNLSLKARGLLSTTLSLPDNWHFTEAGLVSILPKDGRDSLRAAIKELETERFLMREQMRDENGKLGDYVWTFCDYPQVENQPQQNIETQVDYVRQVENPVSENPTSVNPTLDSPTSVNHTQLNTKQSNTDGKRKREQVPMDMRPPRRRLLPRRRAPMGVTATSNCRTPTSRSSRPSSPQIGRSASTA